MCRSIKRLRERDEVAPEEAIREAALQYVRKISGYRQPSPKKAAAFEAAVEEIAAASARLLEGITSPEK
ncbi:MAG: DUF2277 family protein [Chloroflexi bacterium]|nr:DUF2277 family protein [Chloroflexota bacterium]